MPFTYMKNLLGHTCMLHFINPLFVVFKIEVLSVLGKNNSTSDLSSLNKTKALITASPSFVSIGFNRCPTENLNTICLSWLKFLQLS